MKYSTKMNNDEFVRRCKETNPDLIYPPENFSGTRNPYTAICPVHGPITKTANLFYRTTGCSKCAAIKRGEKTRIDKKQWIMDCTNIHDGKYDYSSVEFELQSDKVTIICPIHGSFTQRADVHRKGHGCWECRNQSITGVPRLSVDNFLELAAQKHDNKYLYDQNTYTRREDYVTIICPEHGPFEQKAHAHLSGQGCPQCAILKNNDSKRNSIEDFIQQSQFHHADRYDYSKSEYHGVMSKIEIVCREHGSFWQAAGDHMRGYGCPACSAGNYVSKPEKELVEFIRENYQGEIRTSVRDLISPQELDIYLPEHNLAIEYCGLYWHSEKAGKNQMYHANKHDECKKKGIRLITIFEDEWVEKTTIVKSTLRHFLGNSPKGIAGRKTEIKQITWDIARAFIDAHHLLGSGTPATYCFGAYYGDTLCGVMTFGSPTNEQGEAYVIEMKRYATDGNNNPGVASKMFKHAIQELNLTKVRAFVDRRWFTGTFKAISGFTEVDVTKPSLWWTDFKTRYHRRKFSHIRSPGNGKTKSEYLYETERVSRIWDCGKYVMEWNK